MTIMDRINSSSGNHLRIWITILIGLVLSIVLQYLWIYQNNDLSFHIWGFVFIPAFIVPAIFPIIISFSKYSSGFIREWKKIGKIRYWITAIFVPVLCAVLMIFMYQSSSGEQIEATRGWNALALSTFIDIPVIFIWSLPVLLSIEISWRTFLRISAASVNFLSSVFSSVLWLISGSVFFISIFKSEYMINTIAIGCYFLAGGIFLFWLQHRGSILMSALALMIIFLCSVLLFGCENVLLNRIFFGSDTKTVEGLFSREGRPFIMTVLSGAAAFLFFSFLVYKFKPDK